METFDIDGQGRATIGKSPGSTLDFHVDWTAWLAHVKDTASSYTVAASSGITLVSDSITGGKVTAWVSGGTLGNLESLVFTLHTAGGRLDVKTIYVRITDR